MTNAPRIPWRAAFAFAVLLTVIFGVQNAMVAGVEHDPPPLGLALARQAVIWVVWLGLTPWIVRSAQKHPLQERPTWAWIWRQLLIGGWFALLQGVIGGMIRFYMGIAAYRHLSDVLANSVVVGFARNYLTYWFIAAVYQGLLYHGSVRERDAAAAAFELDLVRAKLEALEGRLRPHFLFNTLNSIAALVRENPAGAEAMIGHLSDLLRASLRTDPLREVSLDTELELVNEYLAIEQVRFQDRLRVHVDAGAIARRCCVPHLILQPLVENAVRHGIAPRETAGTIFVAAERVDGRLEIRVEDDGVGLSNGPSAQAGSGIGLSGVRSRLAYLYGTEQRVDVSPRAPTGTIVAIQLPYHTEPREVGERGSVS